MTARGLTYRYVFALSLVALMAAALLGLSWSATRLSATDGALINQSGRQRMLSQRIALLSYEFAAASSATAETDAERQLRTAFREFINSHNELVLAADLDERAFNIYQAPETNLDLAVVEYAQSVAILLDNRADPSALAEVRRRTREILPLLEMATNAFTIAAEDRAHRLERLEFSAFLITLTVLMLEAFFIFRPAANSIGSSMSKLKDARTIAESASAAKSVFLAQMSHEIRTPLNGVIGMASALETTRLDTDQKRMVSTIAASGDLLLAVVNDVLDLSKIEAGQVRLEEIDFSLEQILNWIDSSFRPSAVAKGLHFQLQMTDDTLGWYRGDPTRIRQVLSNLVSNAIKFTETGTVTVRARMSDDHRILIAVEDSGVGIDPTRVDAIFDPFEQADTSTTRTHGGTGLGLAISRRLCAMMGGELSVHSTVGHGSVFQLSITLPPGEPPRRVETPASVQASTRRIRALVVDDVATNRLVMETLLAPLNVEPVCVESGAAALTAVERDRFDIILMDIQMPGMDGIEASRRIRNLQSAQSAAPTPIAAVTANVLPEQVAAYREAGLDRHLAKPVNRQALEALISELRAA